MRWTFTPNGFVFVYDDNDKLLCSGKPDAKEGEEGYNMTLNFLLREWRPDIDDNQDEELPVYLN